MDNFLNQNNCSRCGKELAARFLSRMNQDVLCMECLEEEKTHPRYKEAQEEELKQVKAGNYNYPGLFAGRKYPFE